MTKQRLEENEERKRTDEAWTKLLGKLANEPVQPKWSAWPERVTVTRQEVPQELITERSGIPGGERPGTHEAGQSGMRETVQSGIRETDRSGMREAVHPVSETGVAPAAAEAVKGSRHRRKPLARSRRKWAYIAAACCLFGAILATPAGNKALAAILGSFRMQDVTAVQVSDLNRIFNELQLDGQSHEQSNKFGDFTMKAGTKEGEYEPEQAAKLLGYKLLPQSATGKPDRVWIHRSNSITFRLNVEEINKAMKKIGATTLLPESVAGRPITLNIPEMVNYNLTDKNAYASVQQMAVPTIEVDPSIPLDEALKAVLDFPLLPDYMKESLRQANVLSGNVPLPIPARGTTVTEKVDGIKVVIENEARDGGSRYTATWTKDGQLFRFNGGSLYADEQSFQAKLKELVAS